MEKAITKDYLYPIFMHPDYLFQDQSTFRPTGSTSAALIYLLHTPELLQTHDYVHVIVLDFSKAFDSARRHSLVSKLANFTLLDCLHNWIANNLSGRRRQHQTKLDGIVSPMLPINASIIQGSALGPVEYAFTSSDLHPTSPQLTL